MKQLKHAWAVWFGNHIHTDVDQKLAIFRTRKLAQAWMSVNGTDGCRIEKLPLANQPWED